FLEAGFLAAGFLTVFFFAGLGDEALRAVVFFTDFFAADLLLTAI
ncbi:MAG: hypothetical protein ACI9OU_001469, partial [Candidatus Promineifilaceae bacterium]